MILLWIGDEMKVDRIYTDGDRLYKVMFQLEYPNGALDGTR